MPIGKIEVVARHLTTIIKMIALDCDAMSTHVLVMACDEIVLNLARHRKLLLDWDHKLWIKDEYHKDYVKLANKAYNYSKHADRDPEAPYDGPADSVLKRINEIKTLCAINGFRALGGSTCPAMNAFSCVLMAKYPGYFKLDFLDAHPQLKQGFERLDRSPDVLSLALRVMLFKEGALPKVPGVP